MNWSAPHGDDGNSHYSELDQINKDNVERLEVAWEYLSGGSGEIGMWWWTGSTIDTNPIVIDGVLYTATPKKPRSTSSPDPQPAGLLDYLPDRDRAAARAEGVHAADAAGGTGGPAKGRGRELRLLAARRGVGEG